MNRRNNRQAAVVLIFGILFLLAASVPVMAANITLRMQAVFQESGPSGQMFQQWADRVELYTAGKVKVKIFPPDQLVKLKEAYDATAKGMIDGCLSSMIYYGGQMPEAKTAFLSFTWENPMEAANLFLNKGYLEKIRKANAQHNVRYVTPIMVGSFGFMTKFPVTSVDDFKGKKIRASGMDGQVVKLMGGAAVSTSPGEMYMALQRGTLDGVVFPYYTLDSYKLYEVIQCLVLPGIREPSLTSIFLNLDVWNKLPKDLQEKIDQAGRDMFLDSAVASLRWNQEALESCKKHGIKIVRLSPQEVANLKKMSMAIWDEVAALSPLNKEIVDLFKEEFK